MTGDKIIIEVIEGFEPSPIKVHGFADRSLKPLDYITIAVSLGFEPRSRINDYRLSGSEEHQLSL